MARIMTPMGRFMSSGPPSDGSLAIVAGTSAGDVLRCADGRASEGLCATGVCPSPGPRPRWTDHRIRSDRGGGPWIAARSTPARAAGHPARSGCCTGRPALGDAGTPRDAAAEVPCRMFIDREDAGRQLADRLADHATRQPIVVALPRGGVIVAAAIAERLRAPLDVIVVRKLGCPWQPELGVGALAEGDVRIVNEDLVRQIGLQAGQPPPATPRARAGGARAA